MLNDACMLQTVDNGNRTQNQTLWSIMPLEKLPFLVDIHDASDFILLKQASLRT